MAYGADGDFNFLEVGRAAFDLSDRGVSGRAQPGPVDAYLYTDRGIYRPGESVHLTALVRDDKADALVERAADAAAVAPGRGRDRPASADSRPARRVHADLCAGARRADRHLAGRDQDRSQGSPDRHDRIPRRGFCAAATQGRAHRGQRSYIARRTVPARGVGAVLFGAPGAGLSIQAEATLAYDDNPFPDEPGYHFGLVDEEFAGKRNDIDAPATDANGRSTASLTLTKAPSLTKPLAVTVEVSVLEPNGRAVTGTVTRPFAERPLAIGLRSSAGDEAVAEGQPASLEIIAVDAAGKRVAANGLRWELLRESWQYEWYSLHGSWERQLIVRDQPLEAGTLDVAAGAPARLTRQLPSGRYRLEVGDEKSGAQSSLRFRVGWWVEAASPDVPDKLAATLDKTSYRPGDTAKLFVKAPFAGEAELAIASDRVLALRSFALPGGGTTVEIPVEKGWGSGVYALVSAYRASDPERQASVGSAAARAGPGRRGRLARHRPGAADADREPRGARRRAAAWAD